MPKQLPSGSSISAITSGEFLLERGGTYSGSIRPSSNVKVGAYGDPAKPKPVVKGRIVKDNLSDAEFRDIRFLGTGLSTSGIRIGNAKRLKILDCDVIDFAGDGIAILGVNGGVNDDVTIEGCTVYKNHPTSSAHCQGIFLNYTTNWRIRYNVIDTNGWNGARGATPYNHNVYCHATNGPGDFEWNVSASPSSYGIQHRCGGNNRNNVYIENEAISYGWVKGERVEEFGIRGEFASNWFLGNRTDRVGWAMDLSNMADVYFHDCYFWGDAQSDSNAVTIKRCEDVENPSQLLDPSKWNCRIERIYKWNGWPNGAVVKIAGGSGVVIDTASVGIYPPNRAADLDKALGGRLNFVAGYRFRPREAAVDAIRRMRIECGLDVAPAPAPQPEPAPAPQPSPAPSVTLESLIRKNPSNLVAVVEGGKAKLKYIQSGTDPRWVVSGDTLSWE